MELIGVLREYKIGMRLEWDFSYFNVPTKYHRLVTFLGKYKLPKLDFYLFLVLI